MFHAHVHTDVSADAQRSASAAMKIRKEAVLFPRLDLQADFPPANRNETNSAYCTPN